MAGSSPTSRSLADLKGMGYMPAIVERWNPHARKRFDLYGFIDLLAVHGGDTLGVQATSGTNHAARKRKVLDDPVLRDRLRVWLRMPGRRFEIWSYSKKGERGKRKLWTLRREELTLLDVEAADGHGPVRGADQAEGADPC